MAHGNEYQKERKYFYLKLPKNWFKNARIKKLRRIAGGDTYTVIYLKMLLMAMNHGSMIIYEGVEKTIEEELALKLDEEVDNVRVTIQFLKASGLWEEKGDDVHLIECDSMIGSETYRNILLKEKKRLKNFNQTSTQFQPISTEIEIEKDIEIDKELDKEKELKKEQMPSPPPSSMLPKGCK